MHLSHLIPSLVLPILTLAVPSPLAIHTQPITSTTTPSLLLTLSYDPTTLNASITTYTPPSGPISDPSTLSRVGLWDPKAQSWKSMISIDSSAFNTQYKKWVKVEVSPSTNEPYHISMTTSLRGPKHVDPSEEEEQAKEKKEYSAKKGPKRKAKTQSEIDQERKAKKLAKQGGGVVPPGTELEDEVVVEVVKVGEGSKPYLNKPIVLNEDGKVQGQDGGEKTFLQKYWWAIGLFLILQLFMSGGKE